MNNRRISKRIQTNDPHTFIEVAVSYNKPPDYVNDRLPKVPYYRKVVAPVKIEGVFEVRTAFSGYASNHDAPARFNARALQAFADLAFMDSHTRTLAEQVAIENGLTLA